MFWQLLANGLVTGSVIAIAAVGVSLIYGILRLVNFAYGDFMAFGALAAYAFNGPLGLGMLVSTLLAMLATAVLSLGLDAVLWRPLRARRAGFMSLFLASIGLALVLRQVLLLAYGPQPHTYKVDQYKVYVIGSVRLSQAQVITILVASLAIVAVVLLTLVWLAVQTPWGRVLRAIREDEDAAASLGKNVLAYKLQALAIGSALAGVAGCFYAWQFSFFSPDDFAPLLTFFAWMIVLIGGLGRIWSVPVGALVFGFLFAGTRFLDFPPLSYLSGADRAYVRLIVIGLVIIGLVLARPQGILGKRDEMVLE